MKFATSFTSYRHRNKCQKQYILGKDNNNKTIYIWDFVKILDPIYGYEWCSVVYFVPVYGAYIVAHPDEEKQSDGSSYTQPLSNYIPVIFNGQFYNNSRYLNEITVLKITEAEYNKWVEKQNIYDHLRLDPPTEFELHGPW